MPIKCAKQWAELKMFLKKRRQKAFFLLARKLHLTKAGKRGDLNEQLKM